MGNPFVHIELATNDVDKEKAFYGKLFDWKLEDVDMGPGETYTSVRVGEGTGGGIMRNPIPGEPSSWHAYVQVDDVKATTKKAVELGGSVIKDVTEIPGMGWYSFIKDPTGAELGLFQNKNG